MSEVTISSGRLRVSLPTTFYPLEGDFREVGQLRREGERGCYVARGHAARSTDGTVLESDGFSQCSALIVQNKKTREAYLAHISGWDLTDLQYEELEGLPSGKYTVRFVVGSLSRVSSFCMVDKSVSRFMDRLTSGRREVEVKDDIDVDSGDRHWSVSYDPNNGKIRVFLRKGGIVYEYSLLRDVV